VVFESAMSATDTGEVVRQMVGRDLADFYPRKRVEPGKERLKVAIKTREGFNAEMRQALEGGIRQFNVESEPEVEQLSRVATSLGRTAHVSFRVNPDVDARTHAKISTGKKGDKFGIPISTAREAYARAAKLPGIHMSGVDMHIGSQITDLQPYDDAYALLAEFVGTLRSDGHTIEHVDVGGRLGIPHRHDNGPPPEPRPGRGEADRARSKDRGRRSVAPRRARSRSAARSWIRCADTENAAAGAGNGSARRPRSRRARPGRSSDRKSSRPGMLMAPQVASFSQSYRIPTSGSLLAFQS